MFMLQIICPWDFLTLVLHKYPWKSCWKLIAWLPGQKLVMVKIVHLNLVTVHLWEFPEWQYGERYLIVKISRLYCFVVVDILKSCLNCFILWLSKVDFARVFFLRLHWFTITENLPRDEEYYCYLEMCYQINSGMWLFEILIKIN